MIADTPVTCFSVTMNELAFVGVYALMLAVPAAGITAVLAIIVRLFRLGRQAPNLTSALVGAIVPAAMAVRGITLSWPWPWHQPERLYDMVPPGPGLIFAALPTLLFCTLTSWMILPRRMI